MNKFKIYLLVIVTRCICVERATTTDNLGTQGITGLPFLSVLSDGMNWHLDVGLSHPGTERGSKG